MPFPLSLPLFLPLSLMQLTKKNELVSLQRKYWKETVKPHPDVECPDVSDEASDTALKPENMIGVFLVIGKCVAWPTKLVCFVFCFVEILGNAPLIPRLDVK